MKILHIIPNYVPGRFASGPNNVTHDLNKWLVKEGMDVTVYTNNTDGWNVTMDVQLNQEVIIDGVKVFYFPTSFPMRWYYSSEFRKKMNDCVKEFDVVHITSAFLATSTIGSYYARKFRKPYVISVYGTFMKTPLRRHSFLKKLYIFLFEKRNIKYASAVHFASKKEKDESLAAGLPIKNGAIIFSGVDPVVFEKKPKEGIFRKKLGISEFQKVILFLGRLNWIKGFDTLIPAFGKVVKERPDAVLVLAGYEAGYGSEIKKMVGDYNLEKNVIIPGPLFDEEKNAALEESDIFVLSSYSEAASISSIEAMFFGLPVVITKSCGFSFEIEKAGAGIAIEKNEEDLKNALLTLLKNDGYANAMGKKGMSFAKNELTFERIAEKFIQLYNGVICGYNK